MSGREIDAGVVEILAKSIGVEIPAEHFASVAERLNEMHAFAAEITNVPYAEFAPAFAFDASWPEGDDQ